MPTLQTLIRPLAIRALTAREWLADGVAYNPLAPHMHADPYPHYARLRERAPIHRSHLAKAWVFSRYDDIDAILRDHKRFSSRDDAATDSPRRQRRQGLLADEPTSMLFQDPPDHTRLRGLVSKAFTPRAIEAMRPHIRDIVDELLAGVQDGDTIDIIDVLAYPLPVIVIAEMLGVPPEDRVTFRTWSNKVARTLEPTITPHQAQEAADAALALRKYFQQLVAERRRNPGDDLMSLLIAAEEEGDKLTEDELLVTLRLLLVAGNETTTNLIANGLLALLRHPDQLQRLRDDPDLTPTAIEELLRFDSPVQTDGRAAIEDVQFDGVTVRRGERVILLLGSANRDAAHFDHPDTLDLGRQDTSHIAFGRGIHHCLGAPLARVEAQVAFPALLDHFREIAPVTLQPRFKDHVVLRGMERLPITVHR